MAFDQPTRNRLARFVSDARILLTEEFTRQLQHEYGLDPASGEITPVEKLTALDDARRETARILRETVDYYLAGEKGAGKGSQKQDVLDRIVREQAFTVLNRLCALRLAEARGIILEAVAQGYQSKGFQLYARLAGSALGETGVAYRAYLFGLFDELAVELPPLFDRFSPQGRLFPREGTLLKLLELLNDLELEGLWAEDETIGWIYQYFNSKEERQAMRAESQAPRNSRELAVRNQFFTPRYVVEFLTDNTLGRIWYEMTRSETGLKATCRYLVRRPNEIFLAEGEEAPAQTQADENLSQEELLRQPVFIPHRPLKDPRELKMLDPACGSMHFGLYAFDLFEQIYAEAWDLEDSLGEKALWRLDDQEPLHKAYPNKQTFLRDMPRLIIERNIHGIDIDSRAVQIARLSLWLRAQRSWQIQGVKVSERQQIRKSNIVCAEAMPGNRQMLEDFLMTLKDERLEKLMRKVMQLPDEQKVRATSAMANALANLVRTIWQELELAGEAGILLKIEEKLRDAISTAKKESEEKAPLFRLLEFNIHETSSIFIKQSSIGDVQDFWNRAESFVLAALREYAEQINTGDKFQRWMFVEDAERGFAFIDLCQKRYDTILMNPPFGDMPRAVYQYCVDLYPKTKFDFHTAFMDRSLQMLYPNGFSGYISNRTWFSLYRLDGFRSDIIMSHQIHVIADLGIGVLDDALVEAACTVLRNVNYNSTPSPVFRLITSRSKDKDLVSLINGDKTVHGKVLYPELNVLRRLPGSIFGYWLPHEFARNIIKMTPFYPKNGFSRQGLASRDNYRFLRLYWEVPNNTIGSFWQPFAKGGEYQPYLDDIHMLIDYSNNGKQLKSYIVDVKGEVSWSRNIPSSEMYGNPGLTFPERTTSDFSPRPLPQGCIFSDKGQAIFFHDLDIATIYLGFAYSRIFKQLIELFIGGGDATESGSAARDYTSGILNTVPFPENENIDKKNLLNLVLKCIAIRQREYSYCEEKILFTVPILVKFIHQGLFQSLKDIQKFANENTINLLEYSSQIDKLSSEAYYLTPGSLEFLDEEVCNDPLRYNKSSNVEIDSNWCNSVDLSQIIAQVNSAKGFRRAFTKKGYWADRRLELLSHLYEISPISLIEKGVKTEANYNEAPISDFFMYAVGLIVGRWDIRIALNSNAETEKLNPYAPLPICPPGMLQNASGLPAEPQDVPLDYPIHIRWNGILVDDESHQEDLEIHVREVFHLFWNGNAEAVEQEICQILHISGFREYFRNPALFFGFHLSRYTKSRRQAPIYWPLSTPSYSYTLWLYYHRLNDQTLFTCVNDFVDPKLNQVSDAAARLRLKKGRSTDDEKELERLVDFERELKDFRAELLRVAAFWKPNLNDGVEITAAPLWKLFQHKPWQKRLKETWGKLDKGDYDWAHLAYSIWPERVRAKCKTDKSLAIAHDLAHLYVEPPARSKKHKGKKAQPEQEEFFDE